jgi:hypothetical protein
MEIFNRQRKVFCVQIIIMAGVERRAVDSMEMFQMTSLIHSTRTGCRHNLHVPNNDQSKYQRGVYYTGMKLFINYLPTVRGCVMM